MEGEKRGMNRFSQPHLPELGLHLGPERLDLVKLGHVDHDREDVRLGICMGVAVSVGADDLRDLRFGAFELRRVRVCETHFKTMSVWLVFFVVPQTSYIPSYRIIIVTKHYRPPKNKDVREYDICIREEGKCKEEDDMR